MGDKMSKTKLNKIVVPTIYLISLTVFGTSMYLIQKVVNTEKFSTSESEMEYVDKEIVNDNIYIPVVVQNNIFLKPYMNPTVSINKAFYDSNNSGEEQENAIIFYENTYIQNTGVSYKNTTNFEILAVLDGTVIDITENEILGKTIKVRHENDIVSTYQSLSEIIVNIDEQVSRGQVIGKSGTSSLYNTDSNLHFELTHQGKNINPEEYYDKSTDEL